MPEFDPGSYKNNLVAERIFTVSSTNLAQKLVGTYLVHETKAGITVGQVVETEAYLSSGDLASHAARGMTKRNEAMFLGGGHAYVYFIYGMYFCFNIVSGREGSGEAVLIRALRPIYGLDLMERRLNLSARKRSLPKRRSKIQVRSETQLCNGPGKLVIAMGITKADNGIRINEERLFLVKRPRGIKITSGIRIGISQSAELKLRFGLSNSKYLSRPMR